MNVNYVAIADDIEANEGIDVINAEAAYARLSALVETGLKNIDSANIKKYLMLADRWLPIKDSALSSARLTIDALSIFNTFELTNEETGPAVKAKLEAIMDALIADSLLSSTDKDVIMAMGTVSTPVWPNLKLGHVVNAIEWRYAGKI